MFLTDIFQPFRKAYKFPYLKIIMKDFTKVIFVLIISYFIMGIISVLTKFLGFWKYNLTGLITVLIVSHYFIKKFNRTIFWKEAIIFATILLIIRFINQGISSFLGVNPTPFLYNLMFLMAYFISEIILVKLISIFIMKSKKLQKPQTFSNNI